MTDATIVTARVREALWHVDAELEKQGWNLPSQLWTVLHVPATAFQMATVALLPLPGWEQVLEKGDDMQDCLRVTIALYRRMPAALKVDLRKDLFGVALASEAWALRTEDPVKAERFQQIAEERQVHAEPDRIECRIIHFAPLDGSPALLMHERDGIAQLLDENSEMTATGEIPELLSQLVQALI